jgi:hypothetical protein
MFGGGCGTRTVVCFSRSAKQATSLLGVIAKDEHVGDTACPQMIDHRLERDGVIVREWWE